MSLENAIAIAFEPGDDGIRRWRDLDIAEWLGLADKHGIRATIQSNADEIVRHGDLSVQRTESNGGRPGTEYWLNFEQALTLCQLSRTEKAKDVREAMTKAYSRLVHGEVSTMPRMEIRALEVAADRMVKPILERLDNVLVEQREFHDKVITRMDKTDSTVSSLRTQVLSLEKTAGNGRLDFLKKTRELHLSCIRDEFKGKCPCCKKSDKIVVDQNGRATPICQEEHWHHPRKRKLEETWMVCSDCNMNLYRSTEFKDEKRANFHAYQSTLSEYMTEKAGQLRLILKNSI